MSESEGSEYDRLFYPFLFEGGKASIEDVLVQVRHSSLEKCREVIELRRATLEKLPDCSRDNRRPECRRSRGDSHGADYGAWSGQ